MRTFSLYRPHSTGVTYSYTRVVVLLEPQSSMPTISVLLVEDHMIVREGLRSLLEAQGDIKVVGQAQDGRQAVDLAVELLPDVIVMDITMPLLNGLEATRRILQVQPSAKVVMLSAHSDDGYVEQVLALGVAGYLIKQTSAQVLAAAVRQVARGETYFSPTISRRFTGPGAGKDSKSPHVKQLTQLTSREREVLQLVAEGKANKQVADELSISIKTVEKHRQHLMEKLGIHDTAGLTRYAISSGVIESNVQVTP